MLLQNEDSPVTFLTPSVYIYIYKSYISVWVIPILYFEISIGNPPKNIHFSLNSSNYLDLAHLSICIYFYRRLTFSFLGSFNAYILCEYLELISVAPQVLGSSQKFRSLTVLCICTYFVLMSICVPYCALHMISSLVSWAKRLTRKPQFVASII